MTRSLTTVLVGGVLAAGLTACGADTASVGDVVEGRSEVEGTEAHVVLPSGTLTITVGEPVDEVTESDSADGEAHAAPSGGALVPVSYDFDPFNPQGTSMIVRRDPQVASVTADVDGESVSLPDPYALEGAVTSGLPGHTVYVATGSGELPAIEVTYDGLAQQVDPATGEVDKGVAELLYEPTEAEDARCRTQVADSVDASPRISCEATVQRVPYVSGHGWAQDPEGFVAVGYRVRIDDMVGYEAVDAPTVTSSLAGQTPVAQLHDEVGSVDSPEEYTTVDVFEPGSGGAEVDLEFAVRRDSGGQGSRPLLVQAFVSVP